MNGGDDAYVWALEAENERLRTENERFRALIEIWKDKIDRLDDRVVEAIKTLKIAQAALGPKARESDA